MKLELKHLAPYLPYGLKCYEPRFNTKHTIIGFVGNEVYIGDDDEICSFVFDNETLPILRPLSDLTKEVKVNGEKFIPFKWFNFINSDIDFETQIIALSNDIKWLDSTYYGIIEKLFEWHFDVFGLIEKGLAIDINTLTQSSE